MFWQRVYLVLCILCIIILVSNIRGIYRLYKQLPESAEKNDVALGICVEVLVIISSLIEIFTM